MKRFLPDNSRAAILFSVLALATAACLCTSALPFGGDEGAVEEGAAVEVETGTGGPAFPQSFSDDIAGVTYYFPDGWFWLSIDGTTVASTNADFIAEDYVPAPLTAPGILGVIGDRDAYGSGVSTVDELVAIYQENFGLDFGQAAIGDSRSLTVGGMQARAFDIDGADPDFNQAIRGRVVVILSETHSGGVYGFAPADQWPDFDATFDEMVAALEFYDQVTGGGFDLAGDEDAIVVDDEPGAVDGSAPDIETTGGGYIIIGQTVSNTLPDGETHEWLIDGRAGQTLTLTVTPEDDNFDVTVSLVGPDGSVVADVDDGFGGEPEVITFSPSADGSYYAYLEDFAFGGGPYTITLEGG